MTPITSRATFSVDCGRGGRGAEAMDCGLSGGGVTAMDSDSDIAGVTAIDYGPDSGFTAMEYGRDARRAPEVDYRGRAGVCIPRSNAMADDLVRMDALRRLYLRKAAVDDLIRSLEVYRGVKQPQMAKCVPISARRKCS